MTSQQQQQANPQSQQDYIHLLKQMQKTGQIGSLGLGTINLDKLHTHL